MPARKAKITKKSIPDFSNRREIFKNSESYKSLFYGIATVIVLFILGIGTVKLFLNHPKPEIDGGAVSVSRIDQAIKETRAIGKTYTVQEDESLWDIAVKKYNDGYKWVNIARANNLANPDTIFTGDKLVIPKITDDLTPTPVFEDVAQEPIPTAEAVQEQAQPQEDTVSTGEKISGTSYTIRPGDDLWEIAVRAYGDGYQWVKIAEANNLTDPSLIFSDNILKLPR